METRKLIEKFIYEISQKYPSIKIGYDYNSDLDEYDIWHTDKNLEFKDKNFKLYVGEKADEFLFRNNIYNFSFGYDYYKYKELENRNKINMEILNRIVHVNVHQKYLIGKEELNIYNCNFEISINTISYITINTASKKLKEDYNIIFSSTFTPKAMIYKDNVFQEAA